MISRRRILALLGLAAPAIAVGSTSTPASESGCPHNNIWYLGTTCNNSGKELAICNDCNEWACCDQPPKRRV